MPAEKVTVDRFIELSGQYPMLDVRSPGEFAHARIPGAYSFPLFTDEERKVVGTAYKQQGREPAIKIGLDYFGGKMRRMVEEAEGITGENSKTVLVHCWRGGMRSRRGLAFDFTVRVYPCRGYKSFRKWCSEVLRPYNLRILGGYTGSERPRCFMNLQQRNTVR
jgi:tRNA 2-selenouridine synthase